MDDQPISINLLTAVLTVDPRAYHKEGLYHFEAAKENGTDEPIPLTLRFCPERSQCIDDILSLCSNPSMPAEMQHEVELRIPQVHETLKYFASKYESRLQDE